MAIHKNYLYLSVGLHLFPGGKTRKDREKAVIVVDLKKKRIEKTINVDKEIQDEPEDVDFYKGKPLLYCGQDGGLYRISTKR